MLHNHQVPLRLLALSCVAGLMVAALNPLLLSRRFCLWRKVRRRARWRKLDIGTVGIVMSTVPIIGMTAIDRFGTRYGEHVTWLMTSRSSLFDRVVLPHRVPRSESQRPGIPIHLLWVSVCHRSWTTWRRGACAR
jgi:hypothetical protein